MWSHFYEKVAHKINFNNSSTKFWSSSPLLNPSVFYDTVIFMSVFWQSGTFWRRTTCRCIKKWNWTTTVVDATWYSRTPLGTELRSTGLKIHLGKISTKLPSYCFGTGHASKLDEFLDKNIPPKYLSSPSWSWHHQPDGNKSCFSFVHWRFLSTGNHLFAYAYVLTP